RPMLFQSPTFLLGFLPVTLVGFDLIGRLKRAWVSALWLTLASLVFYSWWRLSDLAFLAGSIAANYTLAEFVRREQSSGRRRADLAGGVAANLLLLAYLKYTGFLVGTLAAPPGLGLSALLWLAAGWLQIGAPTLTSRWFGDILRIKTARAAAIAG